MEIIEADGTVGGPGGRHYDAIAVHAATPSVPPALAAELIPGGRLVAPIAEDGVDMLTVFRRTDGGYGPPELDARAIAPCRFVPLLGEGGFPES